jgi:dTDP-4-dehydrorhamnose reductase
MKTVLITGASGHIGVELLQMLPKEDFRIIAGTIPEEPSSMDKLQRCDEIIELDYDTGDSVEKVFFGVTRHSNSKSITCF